MPDSLVPPALARERGSVLHRALSHLPVNLLGALVGALRRHSDQLVPGRLYSPDGAGGCAIGVLLVELAPERRPRRRLTVLEEWPELAREHPRLAHIEIVFDNTCQELRELAPELSEQETARRVGLWMAAETQAEINLRHLEDRPRHPRFVRGKVAGHDVDDLYDETVARLRTLRPWLTAEEAERAVERWTGARRAEHVYVPDEWVEEVRLQRERLGGPA